ncbi:hypothetical protein GCM10023175_21350 [Pseudonocardia xishanensis]|uniref:SDR family oxidoreductase n=1 Tax=Pseudonocardia xishanensis TaxID=630995 RepID=A0ABP8RQ92_9PSEU
MAQAAIRHIRRQGFGTIVSIASVSAFLGVPNSTIYSALKGAVVSFTRTLAAEVGPEGIRVNATAPGSVHTGGSATLHARRPSGGGRTRRRSRGRQARGGRRRRAVVGVGTERPS